MSSGLIIIAYGIKMHLMFSIFYNACRFVSFVLELFYFDNCQFDFFSWKKEEGLLLQ